MEKQTTDTIRIPVFLFFALTMVAAGCNYNGRDGKTMEADRNIVKQQFRCPMHHEIVRDKEGNCPICGMELVAFGATQKMASDTGLGTLLLPTNSFVLSTIPTTTLRQSEEQMDVEALGSIQYDTRAEGSIAARVSGRIEKLYLKYTFQDVGKGQKVMDIYSPELLTAQQNLLFLIKNDAGNTPFINVAKEKLLLLGMGNEQLQEVVRSQNPSFTVTVYSNYNGHIHDAMGMDVPKSGSSASEPVITRDLFLKEGMYVQKGQTLLSVYDPHKLWAVLDIYADDQSLVKVGNTVHIFPETAPDKDFLAKIDFIEPFYRPGSRTLAARVYFKDHEMDMPVGSLVKATVSGKMVKGDWLPRDAVISLGLDRIVFKRWKGTFRATRIKTGLAFNDRIQIIDGLSQSDSVATNAQFLIDSESFINVDKQP